MHSPLLLSCSVLAFLSSLSKISRKRLRPLPRLLLPSPLSKQKERREEHRQPMVQLLL
jgi:hypothetical protein